MFDWFDAAWDGPRWKLWSFVAGLGSIPLVAALAFIIAAITGERVVPLILLQLVLLILAGSVFGSGFIESLTSTMNRGGLARESTDHVDKSLSKSEREELTSRKKERRDRRTIRAGLFVIAPIVAFVYFMTIV